MAQTLSDLRNLGPVTQAMLIEAGIPDADALRETGAAAAYRRLKFVFGKRVSLIALYAMDAALSGCHWRDVPPERKVALRAEADC